MGEFLASFSHLSVVNTWGFKSDSRETKNIQSEDNNNDQVLDLSCNLLQILKNIPIVVSIPCRWRG